MRTLVVIHTHPYNGIRREPGAEYEAADFDADLLVRSGQARYRDADGLSGQTYRTRDLAADQPGARRRRTRHLDKVAA